MSTPCCFSGAVHLGTPTGRTTKVHNLDCYIADPPSGEPLPKAVIVVIPDALGWEATNMRLLADVYARRTGARVYMPDFMAGNSAPESAMPVFDIVMNPSPSWFHWFTSKIPAIITAVTIFVPFLYRNRRAVCEPRVRTWFADFRHAEAAGEVKVGTAGFCWGGKYVTLLSAAAATTSDGRAGQTLADCGFTAHPSALVVPQDMQAVERPLSICIGDVDGAMKVEDVRAAKQILEEKGSGRHEVVILPGAKHGFSTRGHPNDKKEMEQAQIAEDQAVAWYAKWLGTNKG